MKVVWKQKTRKALISYLEEKDPKKKEAIYNKYLREPFADLISEVVFMQSNKKSTDDIGAEVLSELIIRLNSVKLNEKGKVKPELYVYTMVSGLVISDAYQDRTRGKNTVSFNP